MEEPEKQTPERENAGRGTRRAVAAIAIVLVVLLSFSAGWLTYWLSLGSNARSLLWAVKTAERQYYKEVDDDALYGEFFDALSLDPYSAYYTKEEYAKLRSSNGGQGADTGIRLSPYETNGMIRVFSVAGNSPADRAGIRRGMYVYRYGKDAASLETGDSSALTAFVRGTDEAFTVECGYDPSGADAALYTLESGAYVTSYCLYRDADGAFRYTGGEMREENDPLPGAGDLAYLRLDEFFGGAAKEFAACLSLMKERNRKGLILDLRSDGGGYLAVFQEIAAYLMKDAEGNAPLAATAKYRSGKTREFRASGNYYHDYFGEDAKIYILADEWTASASECLIGALVSSGTVSYGDIFLRKGATAKTYGKGIMQTEYTDARGNALKLTVAEIFWPNGTSIHGKGVTEEDGAIGIPSDLLPGKEDEMLKAVLSAVC